jgi:hypothetical protein
MSKDFFDWSEREGQLQWGHAGLGDNRPAILETFSGFPYHRRIGVLQSLDQHLSGEFDFAKARSVSNMHSLRREMESRHKLLMRLGK